MKSSHQILIDMGIDWEKVYPKSSEDDDIIDRYGLQYGYFYNVNYTLPAFLIEVLTLYKEHTYVCMYPDGVDVFVPKVKRKYVYFHRKYRQDKKYTPSFREKRTLTYHKGFSGISLVEAIDSVKKACHLYLCNTDAVGSRDRYRLKKYRQF